MDKESFIGGLLSGGNQNNYQTISCRKLIKEGKKNLENIFNDSSFKNNLESRFGKKEPLKQKNKTNDTDETCYPRVFRNSRK